MDDYPVMNQAADKGMKMGTKWRWAGVTLFAVVFVAGVVGVAVFGWRSEIAVASVERGTAVDAVPGVVGVRAERSVELRVEVGGRVVESQLELGGKVEEGDLIFRLDDSSLRRSLDRVRIDLEAEKALAEVGSQLRYDLKEAREDLARKEEGERRFSSRELELQRRLVARLTDEIRREEIAERQRLRALENELGRLEEELEKTVVRAPVGGDVVEVLAHPGDVLSARSLVGRLLSRERVVEATLSEENFSGVAVGQAATVRFLSYGSRLFPAEVIKVLPAADAETQRYTVHLAVDMDRDLMVPGITGEVSIVLGERKDALTIPRRAMMGRDVFVVRDGRVELRSVEPGFVSLNQVEVRSGLEEGDRVAVEYLDRLRDGDRVRVKHHVP